MISNTYLNRYFYLNEIRFIAINNFKICNSMSVLLTTRICYFFFIFFLILLPKQDITIKSSKNLNNKMYLISFRDVSRKEYSMTEITDINQTFPTGGSINSFWNYCNTAANLLKTSLYQLAPSPGKFFLIIFFYI